MPFGNSEMDVPEGQMKIAQRFNAVSAYRGRTRRAATSSAASSGAKASRKPSGPCESFRRCTRRGCRSATTATAKQLRASFKSRDGSADALIRKCSIISTYHGAEKLPAFNPAHRAEAEFY